MLPKARIGGFGWRVAAEMTSEPVVTDFDVLQWSDLVRNSMAQGIVANYWQTLITIWIYISTGTLARLARLCKGSVLAALYPIVVLVAQLIIGVVAALATAQFLAAVLTPWAALFGVVVLPVILIGFRKLDNRIYAYYLMQDYAFSAQQRGAYPTVLGTRIKGFQAQIAHGLKSDVDEMLVIGHSSGAYLAVSV